MFLFAWWMDYFSMFDFEWFCYHQIIFASVDIFINPKTFKFLIQSIFYLDSINKKFWAGFKLATIVETVSTFFSSPWPRTGPSWTFKSLTQSCYAHIIIANWLQFEYVAVYVNHAHCNTDLKISKTRIELPNGNSILKDFNIWTSPIRDIFNASIGHRRFCSDAVLWKYF